MVGYNLLNAYGPEGQALFLEVPWEHEENELRILAATDVEDKFKLRLLGTDSYTRVGNVITVPYPFEEAGLPWRLFIWRVTDVNETVTFDGSRIPVEAIVAKLKELSEKVEEAQLLYRRAVKAPEDMDGRMILPTVAVRKGKVMGFDEHGVPLCGLEYIPEAKEFLDQMKQMLEDMRKLFAELLADATAQITELRDSSKTEIGELRDASKAEIGELCDASIGEIEGLRDSSKAEISALSDSSKDEISKLRDASKQELTDLRDASVSDIEDLRDSSKEEIISLFNTTKAEITVLLEDLKKDAEALKDSTMAELADLANKFVDGTLADFKTRAEEIADDVLQAKVDAAEAARVAAEAARDSANSYATKAMNANTGAWDAYSKSLDVLEATKKLKERCEEIYNVITQYRYVVLTREEYDALVENNSVEEDVIYFVKGTQGLAEIRAELVASIDELRTDLQELSATHLTDKAALETKISAVSDTLKALSARVDALDPDLATEVAELITTYDTAIAELREQCIANANGIATVSSTVNGIIAEVDEKLNSVETRLTEKLSSIAEAKVQTAVDAEATARTEADTVLQGSVTRLSETTTDHETRIKANEAAIAEFVAGDAAWEQSLLEASTQVGSRLVQHEEKVAASNVLGHVYVGGNGIGISSGVLALNIRANYSGITFANKAAYVNCAEQTLHPTAGTVAKVATDTAGALVVPDATDTTKGGVKLATSLDDTGTVSVPTAAQVNAGLAAKASASDLTALDERTTTLESSTEGLEEAVHQTTAVYYELSTNLTTETSERKSTLNAHAGTKATQGVFGHVRLANGITDAGDHAVPRALTVYNALKTKQDVLTAGDNITIADGVISATGGDSVDAYTRLEVDGMLVEKVDKNTSYIAIGNGASVSGGSSSNIAIGDGATATDQGDYISMAIGAWATASGSGTSDYHAGAMAIGSSTDASGECAIVIGMNAQTNLKDSFTIAAGGTYSGANHLRVTLVAGTASDASDSYFVFSYEPYYSGATGVKISAPSFFAMLKAYGGEDYTLRMSEETNS